MNNFEEFWNNTEDSSILPSDSSPESILLAATQTELSLGIAAITTTGLSLSRENNKQAQIEEFSKEVTQYATSKEVISELSNSIGEPKKSETEDQFVERASNALRAILQKKFNV